MSRQQPGSSRGPLRDRSLESSQPRSSLPTSLHEFLQDRPSSDVLDIQPTLPSPSDELSRRILPSLPPLSPNNQSRSIRENAPNREVLPPLRGGAALVSVPCSPSASPASADHDDPHHRRVAFQHSQDSYSTLRGSTLLASHSSAFQPHQRYQLTPVHGIRAPRIVRPTSAHDSAYLSDLSTLSTSSSARGAPPPSHTSLETSAGGSSDSSRTRVQSWRRAQDQGEGQAGESKTEFVGGEFGRYTPTTVEVEYERQHERRAHFPVSTMRGGSVSGRGYPYSYGVPSNSASGSYAHHWATEEEEALNDAPSWSGSEHEAGGEQSSSARHGRGQLSRSAFRRELSGSEAVSSSVSPVPSERSISAHSSTRDYGDRSAHLRWTSQDRTLPEPTASPRWRPLGAGLSPVHASGSSAGGNIGHASERSRGSQAAKNTLRSTPLGLGQTPSSRRSASPVNAPDRLRAGDVPSPPRSLSYTSLPRYSALSSNVHHSVYADKAQYADEPSPEPHEGRYEEIPGSGMSATQTHRSHTYPTTSAEHAQSYQGPAIEDSSDTTQPALRGPGFGTPSVHHSSARTTSTLQRQSRHHGEITGTDYVPGQRHSLSSFSSSPQFSLSASAMPSTEEIARREGSQVSSVSATGSPPYTASAPLATSEKKGLGYASSVQTQYTYTPEAQYLPSQVPQLSRPMPVPVTSSPKTKRSRSVSVEPQEADSTAIATPGAGSSTSSVPIAGSTAERGGRGGTGRGRGRGRGKKAIVPQSPSGSLAGQELRIAAEPPVFWARQQRMAHAAELGIPPRAQASASALAPAPQRTSESPMHPQSLGIPGSSYPAQARVGPPNIPHNLTRKGKGKDDDVIAGDTKSSADADVDELETSDEDGKPHFSIGSAPSRTGSAGGSRGPRTKIEVACDFCRKRKMKCDGLRPTCRNCQRKNVTCSYIPVVRRRGPGKKLKAVDSRPKKTNKRLEVDKKQGKGKTKAQATDSSEALTQGTQATNPSQSQASPQPQASGSGLQLASPSQHFLPGFQHAPGELYLPSPLQPASSPRHVGRPPTLSGANFSPFPSALHLPLYPPEQFPYYAHNASFEGDMFMPRHSPTMGVGARIIADPRADVNVSMAESSGSIITDVGPRTLESAAARTASMLSSRPSSSKDEVGRLSSLHRVAKRSRADKGEASERELEEGEIDEGGPSSGTRR